MVICYTRVQSCFLIACSILMTEQAHDKKIRILSVSEELKRARDEKSLHSSATRNFSSHLSEEMTKCKNILLRR